MIYEPIGQEGYECINTMDWSDYEVFASFDGSPRRAQWKPIRVWRVRANAEAAALPSDFPWLGKHALVMRKLAVDVLRGLLEAHGEVLPLETDDGIELSVLNVTTIRDALDEQRSTIWRFRSTQRIMRIKKPVFRASLIRGADIFRLPHRMSPTYVSHRFVQASRQAGLVGLDFNEVFSEPN